MNVGIEIGGVQDTNIMYYTYEEGINDFIDRAVLIIPDPEQDLWLSGGSPYDAANYLFKDVEIKNEYGEGSEYIAFKGRISAPPEWRNGFITINVEGYMAQFKDRLMGDIYTVEDIDAGQSEYTGYLDYIDTNIIIDSSKAWNNDDYNGGICFIDQLATIPDAKQWLNIDWEADNIDVYIQASADDAHYIEIWNNNGITLSVGSIDNIYLRFPINIPKGATIGLCHLYILKTANPIFLLALDYRAYLIDSDNCAAFPDGTGDETGYPVTATFVDGTFTYGGGYKVVNITTLLQAFIDRAGYVPGTYMGIKITRLAGSIENVFVSSEDPSDDPPVINIEYSYDIPSQLDFIISDTRDGTTLDLTDFSIDGFILGKPYMISKSTDDIVKTYAEAYDLDETVTVDESASNKGIIFKLMNGAKPIDMFNQCRKIDGFIIRLKHDMTFIYKPIGDIANAGNLGSEIKDFSSTGIPGSIINLVEVRNKDGTYITRGWDYTGGVPQDDSVANLPADYQERHILLPTPKIYGKIACIDIADQYLEKHAVQDVKYNINIKLAIDMDFEPGEKITFDYDGVTYTDYLITRKKFNSLKEEMEFQLVKY